MASTAKTLIQTMRPPFLILPLTSVLLGAAATSLHTELNLLHLLLIVLAAVCANISVNMLNEYSDYKTGLDLNTERTPFSGGSGALPDNPAALQGVLIGGLVTLGITLAIGGYFLSQGGWPLAVMGLVGALIIITYTDWLNRSPLACLLAPGVSFGPLMVLGTELALSGQITAPTVLVSLLPLFLVSNLLLMNQFPDIEADRKAGRNHLLIQRGVKAGQWVYTLFALAALVILLASVLMHTSPLWLAAALPSLLLIGVILKQLFSFDEQRIKTDISALTPAMGQNVLLTLLSPSALAAALLLN